MEYIFTAIFFENRFTIREGEKLMKMELFHLKVRGTFDPKLGFPARKK